MKVLSRCVGGIGFVFLLYLGMVGMMAVHPNPSINANPWFGAFLMLVAVGLLFAFCGLLFFFGWLTFRD